MTHPTGASFEQFRGYLRMLVDLQMDPRLRGKLDPSGVVQQTLLEAHQTSSNLESTGDGSPLPWLRRILANNLADEIRKLHRAKRGGGREVSLEQAMEQSSLKLEAFAVADDPSPSHHVVRQEQVLRLTAALARLPEAQRDALVLQHWHGWHLAQIADHMGRTRVAVAGLIKRAIQSLREDLANQER